MASDRETCPVCRGSRFIRLPLYRTVSLSFHERSVNDAFGSDIISKEYPCPECSPTTDIAKVTLLSGSIEGIAAYLNESGFREHMARNVAQSIGDALLRGGLLAFAPIPENLKEWDRFELRGTIGVVTPNVVNAIEDRVNAKLFDVANDLAAEAGEQIRNWGSDYTGRNGPINKDDAVAYGV